MHGLRMPVALVRRVCRLAVAQQRSFSAPAVVVHSRLPASAPLHAPTPSPMEQIVQRVGALQSAQQRIGNLQTPTPPAPSSSSAEPSADATARRYPPPSRNRYHSVSWRFSSAAQAHSIQSALEVLATEGRALHAKRQAERRAQHERTLAEQQAQDDALRQLGKKPPPRAALSPPDASDGQLLDWLCCHPPRTYLELMRAFASHGDVDGCYALLTQLYQLAMYTDGLVPWPSDPPPTPRTPHHRHPPRPQSASAANADAKPVEGAKKDDERRSPFTPTGDLLGAVMTAYTQSHTAYPAEHHQQLLTHLTTVKAPPSAEFLHSLMVYHAHQHSVHTYLTSMAMLSRSRHPPPIDEYVRAIRYFGLQCGDQDAALVLFLHLTAFALPNASAYNTLIAVYGEKGDWMAAHRLMGDMERQGQWLSSWTYAGVIRALLVDGKAKEALDVYQWVRQWKRKEITARGERWHDNVYLALMRWHDAQGDVDAVMARWQEMKADRVLPEPTTYAAVVHLLVRAERGAQACTIVAQMQHQRGLKWDAPAYFAALEALCHQGNRVQAQRVYASLRAFMAQKKLVVPSHVFSTLLKAYPSPAPARAGEKTAARPPLTLCLDLLSLLRDAQRDGAVLSGPFVRTLRGRLDQYGARQSAQRLSAERLPSNRWTEDTLRKAEEDVRRALTHPEPVQHRRAAALSRSTSASAAMSA